MKPALQQLESAGWHDQCESCISVGRPESSKGVEFAGWLTSSPSATGEGLRSPVSLKHWRLKAVARGTPAVQHFVDSLPDEDYGRQHELLALDHH